MNFPRGLRHLLHHCVALRGLFFPDVVKKGTRGFHFPRGLRTHRYHCVALRALMKSQPSKPSPPSQTFFLRGLRHHRYHCVALRALMKSQPSKPSKPSKPSQPSLILHSTFFILHSTFFIFRGVYTPIAIVVTGLLAEVKG